MEEEKKEGLPQEEAIQEEAIEEEKQEAPETEDVPEPEESLEDKLEKAEAKAKDAFDRYLRQVAEFDNYRRRTTAEKASMYSDGVRDTVEKLLPVIDNLERAVDTSEETESSLYTGVGMILKQLRDMLTAIGVEEIPAEGEPFDPQLHNAVMHIEDEKCDTSVVVEVFQKGYRLGGKVIRHSMVKVAN